MTTNIHFIGGEKGGVGKSLMARVLAQYLIDKQLPFLGFDTDRSHGALMRFYSGYASPVAVDKVESLDAIVEAAVDAARPPHPRRPRGADARPARHAGWTTPACSSLADELGMKLFYWHVMDSGKDSVDLLRRCSIASAPACTTCWCATRCAAPTSACSSSRASRRARSAWARTSSR